MDVLVAAFADHEGLALVLGHQAYPFRLLGPPRLVEVGEFADVVDLQPGPRFAHLAPFGQEPMNRLVALRGGQRRLPVGNATGKDLNARVAHHFVVRGGRIARFEQFVDTSLVRDAMTPGA